MMWWQEHWAELTGLSFVAFQAGLTIMQLKGIATRLDRVNGRLDNHGERLGLHGERISKMEGGK